MFNFLKRRGRLNRELCEIVKKRAIDVMRLDNREIYILDENKLITGYKSIDNYKAIIDDVMTFANEYGCTVDYLLGRTDTPYYTL